MNLSQDRKKWIKKALAIIIVAEILYLVIINAALRLPLTQTLINQIRPEKFSVSWEQAWSWYPFRVHARGVSANGQSRSQQWQLKTPSAAASIAVLPLIFKRVWVSDVIVGDVDYRQRPRLKPGKDYSDLLPHFPQIEGREIADAITTPRKDKRPWHIALNKVRASGQYKLWIYQAQGSGRGDIRVDLTFQTRGGPFSLDAHQLDLNLDPLYLNGKREVYKQGQISGSLGFAPFVPRENKGVALLRYLKVDTALKFDLNNLQFINLFTQNFQGLAVDGSGRVNGLLRYDQGHVLTGTDLSVDADDLRVGILSHLIAGDGAVKLQMGPATDESFDLEIRYRDLQVTHEDEDAAILTGQGLRLNVGGNGLVLVDPERPNRTRSLGFTVDGLALPDLGLLQRYLPQKWPFKLHGGDGQLHGFARLAPTSLAVDLTLESDGADLAVRDYRFFTNLGMAVKLDNPAIATNSTRLDGTYIEMTDARLRKEASDKSETWDARLQINAGEVSVLGQANKTADDKAADLLKQLGNSRARQLLDRSEAHLEFEANVSSLAWIGVLFVDDYNVAVAGEGGVKGVLNIASGWPAPGTDVEVASPELAVKMLDYRSNGDGRVTLKVQERGEHPDWLIDIALRDADFKRSDEEEANIQQVDLNLSALLPDVDLESGFKPHALALKIHSAKVLDMSTFNAYLPPDGSLQFTRGTADLAADIELHSEDADGWVRLHSAGLEAQAGSQSVGGDLAVDVQLAGGVPRNMAFDVSGSRLRLDNVRVIGEEEQFDDDYWSASFELLDAQTVWTRPPQLDIQARLLMSDSRPVVAMFENRGRRPKFLAKMLTVEDIKGTASLRVADETLTIHDAHAISDNIEIGARGWLGKTGRDAVVYLRYKKADGLIRFEGDGKNIDIIGVKKKYDEFQAAPEPAQGRPAGG